MFHHPASQFFLCGLAIAGLEEFITQGVLRGSYFLWVFTLVPFAVFLGIAACVRWVLHNLTSKRLAAVLYYVAAGEIGLAVEWFIIGLAPWNDTKSPPALIAVFHAGVFSFWGTVALAPHILLDPRPQVAGLKRRMAMSFGALMAATYGLTLAAKLAGAGSGAQFLASIGPMILTFLAMNVFYVQYFSS